MSKRAKFVLAAVILSGLLFATRLIVPENRLTAIIAVSAFSYAITAWVLFEDLKGVEWFMIMILPVLYTLGAGMFSLFLPEFVPRIFGLRLEAEMAKLVAGIVRTLFWGGFGVGLYALFLTENIFSVAAIRTIQLLRAAHAVGFLLTLVTGLLLYQSIFSFKFEFWANALLVGGLSFLLFLQGNWSMFLKEGVNKKIVLYSFLSALIITQMAVALSFWPIKAFSASLLLISSVYVLLGLSQLHLVERLFKNQINEYLVVGVLVLVASFLVTSWR
jgi:hypothetical protein